MTNGLDQAPVPCFLSYAQKDDAVLGLVEDFRRDLAAFCFGDHGRRVEVFLDRRSLGWGTDWREEIGAAVDAAMVFLPLVTLTYFERRYCREELLQFYSSARGHGVGELLLPVLVLGQQKITADSTDTAVRIIADRQGFDFRTAALAGPGTREWRTAMAELAARLVAAVGRAESRLSAPAGPPDLAALDREVAERAQGLLTAFTELARSTQAFLRIVRETADAVAIDHAGRELARCGSALERAAVVMDGAVRDHRAAIAAHGTPEMLDRLRSRVAPPQEEMAQLPRAFTQALAGLRPAETAGAPMRQALNSARAGLRAAQSAFGIIQGWARLA
ncbi:toll/interleukin-1 receptor domain-containing protein [Actinokineospora sp. 24-640]